MELTNEQWEKIKDLIPDPVKRADGRGRLTRDKRQVLGVMRHVVEALAKDLMERGSVYLSECFIDDYFCMSKKGPLLLAILNAVKAPNSWQSRTLQVLFFCLNPLSFSSRSRVSRVDTGRTVHRTNVTAFDRRQDL